MSGPARTVAIVQARMGSTRLPGKVLADVGGRPMLWHVVSRLRRARRVDAVGVATTVSAADDPVAAFCRDEGVPCVRGSEHDVLDRYRQAAHALGAETVVRITADCPLLDPAVVDRVVDTFAAGEYDYACNVLRPTYPDGLDVEVFSRAALERTWREAEGPAEREHVTVYLRSSGRFRVAPNVESEPDLSGQGLRWTVDSPADLEFVRRVYAALGSDGAAFGLPEVLRLLKEHPEMGEINSDAVRNEGYYLSLATEPPVPAQARSLIRSASLLVEAQRRIPGASQTFSKATSQFVQGVAPTFLSRGQGCRVWDVDGNEYLDYPMALAPVVLGHNDPDVTAAVARQMQDGTAYSLPHPLEVEVAELLCEVIPCAEMVRFGKNGSDATAGAVRLARAATGRDVIVCCGYHGWQDWYIGTTTRSRGVPKAVQELTRTFAYNDPESLARVLDEHKGRVAGVVMEPVGVVEPKPGFLERVRELTHTHGALLIFDEIVTGFRWAMGGAQEFFGVTPDLACFGKAMANGFPIAALVGPRELMAVCDEIFFSFTFGGETVGLAAAKATIAKLRREPVIPHLWAQGQRLKDGYNTLAHRFGVARYTECIGYAPRTVITFRDSEGAESLLFKSYVQQECLKRGILFSGGQNLSFSHSDADVEYTLRVYRTVLELFRDALAGDVAARLEGPPVQPVFRRA
jgi:glutamate-1-semialdehyde 2,1-aminomutase/spore coat polysaccharide biosynthesis protein SpsF